MVINYFVFINYFLSYVRFIIIYYYFLSINHPKIFHNFLIIKAQIFIFFQINLKFDLPLDYIATNHHKNVTKLNYYYSKFYQYNFCPIHQIKKNSNFYFLIITFNSNYKLINYHIDHKRGFEAFGLINYNFKYYRVMMENNFLIM